MTDSAFEKHLSTLRGWLMDIAVGYLPDRDRAEDIVQEACIRLWKMRQSLTEPIQPMARVLVRNLAVDYYRRQKNTVLSDNLPDNQPSDDEPTTAERAQRLIQTIATLRPKEQQLLRMRHFEQMSMNEIAEQVNANEVAVRQQLSRARKALRSTYLSKYKD